MSGERKACGCGSVPIVTTDGLCATCDDEMWIASQPASAGEAGTADTPQSESVHEHATAEGGDAQASATPPSSGTQS